MEERGALGRAVAVDRRDYATIATPVTSAQAVNAQTVGGMKLRGSVLVGAAGENVGDLIVDGKKPLHLPRRLETLHDPLSSSGRFAGILRPVVKGFVRPCLTLGMISRLAAA